MKEKDLKSLKMLHTVITLGSVALFVAMAYFIQSRGEYNHNTISLFFIFGAIMVPIGLLTGSKIYGVNIKNALNRTFDSYDEAFQNFKVSNLIRWVTMVGPINVGLVLAFLDQNPYLLAPSVIGIFYVFISKVNDKDFKNYTYQK